MTSRLITPQLAELFKLYPLYSQDGKKKDAICQCVFFIGKVRWYVLEGQPEGNDFTLFYVYIPTFCKTSQYGSRWQKTFAIWQYQVLSIEAIFMRYSMHEVKKQKLFLTTSENYWGGVTGFSLL